MTTLTKVREIASCHREASEGFARWREQLHKAIREAYGCRQHGGTDWLSPFLCEESYEIAPGTRDPCFRAVTLGQLAQATGYTRQRISQIVKEA